MSSTASASDFVITLEHQRFAEFCDACQHYRYIGLCYGPPGVGKTLSARHYANWDQIENQIEGRFHYRLTPDADLNSLQHSRTVFYTPKVSNTPRQIEADIDAWRRRLRAIPLETLKLEEADSLRRACAEDKALNRTSIRSGNKTYVYDPPKRPGTSLKEDEAVRFYFQKRREMPDPTTLLMIDEADRLKTASLEQMRDIFDQGGVGVVLIGMPGLEKRLSRYPQLYSRVGFVHEFRPLSADTVRDLLQQNWLPNGIVLPDEGLNDEEVIATIIRITAGNFRLLHRLLTQISRLAELNSLSQVTREVVETARESLVIGVV